MKKNAFTLIELLVVVAIIGILAAVGVVAYNGYTSSAKKNVAKQNHKLMVKEFQVMVTSFDINGSISRKINGGSSKTFNTKNSAFDCPAFQHHFKDIKTPFADASAISKQQDIQVWAGRCCPYGKEGRTYVTYGQNKTCTFSTFLSDNNLKTLDLLILSSIGTLSFKAMPNLSARDLAWSKYL